MIHFSRNASKLLTISAILLSMPGIADANAGTPLMWASMLHLVFGNLFIGIGEGLLLAWLLKLKFPRTIGLMILANYFSAWAASLLIDPVVRQLNVDLVSLRFWFWTLVAASFVATLILEFPFVPFAARGQQKRITKSFLAFLLTQSVSYALLFGYYWSASATELLTDVQVVDISTMSLPQEVVLYYIDPGGDLYRQPLSKQTRTAIAKFGRSNPYERVIVRRSRLESDKWDLEIYLDAWPSPTITTLQKAMSLQAAPRWRDRPEEEWYKRLHYSRTVATLGSAIDSEYEFFCGFWAAEGLSGYTRQQQVRCAIETPFIQWRTGNAIHLPGDKVLFQLGDQQICVFDPDKQQIAMLTRGHGPLAVIEAQP